jgi:hypothetical protein
MATIFLLRSFGVETTCIRNYVFLSAVALTLFFVGSVSLTVSSILSHERWFAQPTKLTPRSKKTHDYDNNMYLLQLNPIRLYYLSPINTFEILPVAPN